MGPTRKTKTKRRTRDLDQIHNDIHTPKHLDGYLKTKAPEDLPGLGEFYCVECAKWFEGMHNLVVHRRGKGHKRRLRLLKEKPYTQKEAEAAIGLGTDDGGGERVRSEDVLMEMDEGAMEGSGGVETLS